MSNEEEVTREKRMTSLKECLELSQPLLSMVVVQAFMVGLQLLLRVILVQDSFIFSLVTYRHLVAAACVAPFALYFERGRTMKFTLQVWFWLFLNALLGMTLAQGSFYYGVRDTSATYSVNFLNLVPIFTFFTSIICRMEKLRLHTWAGRTKCGGAILCIGGALCTCFYKGKEFYLGHHHHNTKNAIEVHPTHMLRGTLFLIATSFLLSTWFLIQAKLLKVFPLKYWGTTIACILAAIQGAVIGVCIDSSKAAWRLEWNLQLLTVVYSGALVTAATFCIQSWAIVVKGPTYPPMFNPMAPIFVAFLEAIVLGEPLSNGMILGVILITVGVYSFLWGKNNETVHIDQQPNVAATQV